MRLIVRIVLAFYIFCFFGTEIMAQNTTEQLASIIKTVEEHEGYDNKAHPMGLFTREYFKAEAEFAAEQLEKLKAISADDLSETDAISLEMLKFLLQDQINYYEFDRYLNPLLSDSGFHTSFPYMVRPLTNYEQVISYLNKLNAIPSVVDNYIPLLREGLERGMSQPRVIFKGYESTYNSHIVESYEDSFFYGPFKNLPESLSEVQKDSILKAAKETISEKVVPQFRRVKKFFEEEYFPKTRKTIGVSETPNGREYYQNRINYYTTSTQYTADDIHNIGLREVARIKAEMNKIIAELKFEGSFADFLKFLRTDPQFYVETPEELLMHARDMAKRADAQLPKFLKPCRESPTGWLQFQMPLLLNIREVDILEQVRTVQTLVIIG